MLVLCWCNLSFCWERTLHIGEGREGNWTSHTCMILFAGYHIYLKELHSAKLSRGAELIWRQCLLTFLPSCMMLTCGWPYSRNMVVSQQFCNRLCNWPKICSVSESSGRCPGFNPVVILLEISWLTFRFLLSIKSCLVLHPYGWLGKNALFSRQ